MSEIRKNLGGVTAYAYARSKGYTGTEEEFAQLMANYATVGETATEAAEQATTKAGEASTSATNAATSASAASTSATAAAASASAAATSETNAAASASSASTSAGSASESAGDAAESAAAAQAVKDSIPADYTALSGEVTDLKNALEQENIVRNVSFSSAVNGEYINYNGEVVSNSSGNMISNVSLKAGETISFTAKGYSATIAMIAVYYDNAYIPVVVSSDDEVREYVYTASQDSVITLSWLNGYSPSAVITVNYDEVYKIKDCVTEKIDLPNSVHDSYITSTGAIGTSSGFGYSYSFQLGKGDRAVITAKGYSNAVSILSNKVNETTFTPLVLSVDAVWRAYEFTAEQDYNDLYVSYDYKNPVIITVYRKFSEKIANIEHGFRTPTITPTTGEYVNQWGDVNEDVVFAMSQPIAVSCGELIDFYGKGWDNTTAMISTCDSAGSNIIPKVIAPDHDVRHYRYTVTQDGYIVLSYDRRTAPSLIITKANTIASMETRLNEIDGKIDSGISVNLLTAFDNITCIGDSLTYSQVYTGQNTSRQAYVPYPKAIGRKTGANYQILATPGKSASEIWTEYNEQIIARTNDLTIVYLGTNGGLTDTVDTDCAGDDYTQYANTNTGRYGSIIKKSLDAGNKVVLVKVYSSSGNLATTNSVITKLGTKFNVPIIENKFFTERCFHAFPDGSGQNPVHYNDFGYNKFADYIIGKISSLENDDLIKILP